MRDRNSGYSSNGGPNESATAASGPLERKEISYDESRFFESFYRSSTKREISDRITIGNDFSLIESKFHYNATENSILKALARRNPPPHGPVVAATEMMARRRRYRLLDIGSGTGHWVDFFRNTLLVTEATCVEITDLMAEYLQEKYANDADVSVLKQDICDPDFTLDSIGGPVDYISAIGVMFHIVDDDRWQIALNKLAKMLKPNGILVVGGDFGAETKNVQFHKTDKFDSWREYSQAEAPETEVRVNKRVRSLSAWHAAATQAGLAVADLVRSDAHEEIRTPENDILILTLEHRP